MTPHEEAIFDAKAEKMLAGHRQPPNGRNMLAFRMRYLDNPSYRDGFDSTLPDAPGGPDWWENQFCPDCDRRRSACVCGTDYDYEAQPKEPRFMTPRGVIKG